MPIPELKKLTFLLRFQERDLATLRRRSKSDPTTIALRERIIVQLKTKINRLTYAQPSLLRDAVRLL